MLLLELFVLRGPCTWLGRAYIVPALQDGSASARIVKMRRHFLHGVIFFKACWASCGIHQSSAARLMLVHFEHVGGFARK